MGDQSPITPLNLSSFLKDEDEDEDTMDEYNLLCHEPLDFLYDDDRINQEDDSSIFQRYFGISEDDDHARKLIEKEIRDGFGTIRPRSSHDASISDTIAYRSDAITWILEKCQSHRFRNETAYLSVTYFDRFLSKRLVNAENIRGIRLLSVACLCLAAKMVEHEDIRLSMFSVGDYEFHLRMIKRMELMILSTLEWKMISVTPFDYIHYFIIRFCYGSASQNTLSRSVNLIFDISREINILDYRPSVIAIAAALLEFDQNLTREAMEFKINVFSSSGNSEIDDVFYFYNRMLQLETQRNNNNNNNNQVRIVPGLVAY